MRNQYRQLKNIFQAAVPGGYGIAPVAIVVWERQIDAAHEFVFLAGGLTRVWNDHWKFPENSCSKREPALKPPELVRRLPRGSFIDWEAHA